MIIFLSIIVFLLESLKVASEASNTTSSTTSSATSHKHKWSGGGGGGGGGLLRGYGDGDLGVGRSPLSGSVYVSPVIRDISFEVFQVRDINSLFDYLSGFGLDCHLPAISSYDRDGR